MDDGATSPSAGSDAATNGAAPPLSEWIVAAIGAIMVVSAIGQLLYTALVRDQTPPEIRLITAATVDLRDGYLVSFRALNDGLSAAAEVVIEGRLAGADGAVEMSEATLDYLPPRSEREGGLFFSSDPRTGQLRLRAKGFAAP